MKRHHWLATSLLAVALGLHTGAATAKDHPWARSYDMEKAKEYQQAIEAIRSFTKTPTTAEYAWLRVAWLEYLNGDYRDSIKAYREALSLNPRSLDARMGLTLPLLALKRYAEAADQAQKAVDEAPGNYTANTRLAYCDWVLGRWQHLEKRARIMTGLFPAETDPWLYLARAKTKLGDASAARSAYRQLLIRWPGNAEAHNALR